MSATRRVRGLDGVRGLAIVLVVLSHAQIRYFGPGGIAGVTTFFTLSGFLITGLLLREWDQNGRISLRAFWGRRALRLLPALVVFVILVSAAYVALNWETLSQAWRNSWPVLFYYANFASVHHHLALPFRHTWSLAVEEQFYVIWPLLLWALLLLLGRRKIARVALTILFVLLTLASFALRVRTGQAVLPQTTIFSMTAGATLAVWFENGWRPGRWAAPVSGVLLVVFFVAMQTLPGKYAGWTWGPATFTVLALGLIACGCGTRWTPLAVAPMTFIGTVSYAWYLYHFPFMPWALKTAHHSHLRPVAVVVLSFAVSVASWYLVEKPLQRKFKPRLERVQLAGTAVETERPPEAAETQLPARRT